MARFDNAQLRLESGELLQYHDAGTGNSVMLLLHGLNAHSGTWRKNIPLLSQERRVIAPSLPPAASLRAETIDIWEMQALELLSALRIGGVAVAGNSMGGWLAMRLASGHQGLVWSMILEDTAGITESSGSAEMLTALNRSDVETLIVWGANDSVIPVSTAYFLHSSLKSSRLMIVDGAGHVPHWEEPDIFDDAVISFLRI